jgi:aminoglycoside 3-N-acetyltransferase
VWVDIEEFDTCKGIVGNAEEYFTRIAQEFLSSGRGRRGKVGMADSCLFDATLLGRERRLDSCDGIRSNCAT